MEDNLSKVIKKVGEIKLNSNNVIDSLHIVMECVEKLDNTLKGLDKKNLALDSIKYILNNQSNICEEDKTLIERVIDQVAPQVIDVLIKVGNGLSDLVVRKVTSCCF